MNDSDSVICIFSSSDDEKALEEVENFEDDEDQPDILIDTSKDYIKPTYNFAKYYNPDKKPAKNDRVTGHSLLANMVPSLVVIDIDQPKNRQVDLWAMFKDKLSDKDVVVKTGSGGLHIYCKKGTFKPKNNRMTHWYDSPDFSIDIFSTLDPNSQSNIILPGSHVRKVIDKKKVELVYKFLRGGTDEPITFNPITRTVNEVLQAIGIEGPNNKAYKETPEKVENKKIDKKPTKVRDHNPTDIFDPALIEAVIAGFDGLTIHNDGAGHSRREEITLFQLFPAINSLPDGYDDKAYDQILENCELTDEAEENWDAAKQRYKDRSTSLNVMIEFLQFHNPEYYEKNVFPILPAEFEIRDIDLHDDFCMDTIMAKAERGIYTRPQEPFTDLSRVIRYVHGKSKFFLEKVYDDMNKTYTTTCVKPDEMGQILKKIKLWKQGKFSVTLGEILEKYKSKLTVRGTAFYSTDKRIFMTFHGYKYPVKESFDISIIQPFLNLIKEVIANENENVYQYVLKWIAKLIQNPGRKLGTVLVLKGLQGIGKGRFTDTVAELFAGYAAPNVTNIDNLVGKYNDLVENRMLIVCNELKNAGDERVANFDSLKSLVTDTNITIEAKYLSPRLSENVANFIFVTNNAYPVKVEMSDRRYCVLDCSARYKGNNEYFDNLEDVKSNPDFYPTLMTFFAKYDTQNFVPERIPQTQARINLIKASLSLTDRWICKHYNQLCVGMDEALVNTVRPRHTKKFMKFQKSSFLLELKDKCTYDKEKKLYTLRPEAQRLYLPYKHEERKVDEEE